MTSVVSATVDNTAYVEDDAPSMDQKVATVISVTQCTKDEAVSILFFHSGNVQSAVQTILDQRQQPTFVEIGRTTPVDDAKKVAERKKSPEEDRIEALEAAKKRLQEEVNRLKGRNEDFQNRLRNIQTETEGLPDPEEEKKKFLQVWERFRRSTIPVLCDVHTPSVSPDVFSPSGFGCLADSDDEALLKFSSLEL